MTGLFHSFLFFLVPTLLAGLTVAWLWRPRNTKGIRLWGASALHALLCILVLLLLNGCPGHFSGNADQAEFAQYGRTDDGSLRNVVTIDNSVDKVLVPDLNANAEDSAQLAITDRNKLARLLRKLANDSLDVEMVICDIAFTAESPHDSLLREAILDLAAHNRILLAKDPAGNVPLLQFGDSIMADVSEAMQDGKLAWHSLLDDQGWSLPYALHLRISGRTAEPWHFGLLWESGPHGGPVHSGFMPTWAYLPFEAEPGDAGEEAILDRSTMSIGHALDLGWPRLVRQLRDNMRKGPPLVFIGEFDDAERDVHTDRHETFIGARPGAELLIDLLHELDAGAHHIDLPGLGLLYLVFLLCSAWVFSQAHSRPDNDEKSKRKKRKPGFWISFITYFWESFKLWSPSLVLLVVVSGLAFLRQHQMNFAPLMLYFLALIAVVQHVALKRSRD